MNTLRFNLFCGLIAVTAFLGCPSSKTGNLSDSTSVKCLNYMQGVNSDSEILDQLNKGCQVLTPCSAKPMSNLQAYGTTAVDSDSPNYPSRCAALATQVGYNGVILGNGYTAVANGWCPLEQVAQWCTGNTNNLLVSQIGVLPSGKYLSPWCTDTPVSPNPQQPLSQANQTSQQDCYNFCSSVLTPSQNNIAPPVNSYASEIHTLVVKNRQTGELMEEYLPTLAQLGLFFLYTEAGKASGEILVNLLGIGGSLLGALSGKEGPKILTSYEGKKNSEVGTDGVKAICSGIVQQYAIDVTQFAPMTPAIPATSTTPATPATYSTGNDYFHRNLVILPKAPGSSFIAAPSTSRAMFYPTSSDASTYWIKGVNFSVGQMLGNPKMTSSGQNTSGYGMQLGPSPSVAIFRLAPQDYHHFHAPTDGKVVSLYAVGSGLDSVNPIAFNTDTMVFNQSSLYISNVFGNNKRVILEIQASLPSTSVGSQGRSTYTYYMVIIGALGVATIQFNDTNIQSAYNATGGTGFAYVNEEIKQAEDMGYFQYGGSTVVLVIPTGLAQYDQDLLKYSNGTHGISNLPRPNYPLPNYPLETYVTVGEEVGTYGCSGSNENACGYCSSDWNFESDVYNCGKCGQTCDNICINGKCNTDCQVCQIQPNTTGAGTIICAAPQGGCEQYQFAGTVTTNPGGCGGFNGPNFENNTCESQIKLNAGQHCAGAGTPDISYPSCNYCPYPAKEGQWGYTTGAAGLTPWCNNGVISWCAPTPNNC